MKIYKKENVYEEALDRIRFVYDEFDDVVVSFSGGKDSTVILEMAIKVAKEKNRLPINVFWLDQEAELKDTEYYCEYVFRRPEVKPYWMQIPFKLFNSSSFFDTFLTAWDPKAEDKWCRKQTDISYKKNTFGEDRFYDIYKKILVWISGGRRVAEINGLKCDESFARRLTLTVKAGYKGKTWSNQFNDKHVRFSPIYDWKVDDVWIAINKNGWRYNDHYDKLYQHGEPINHMRVSNLIHETAAEHALKRIQEIEPETYDKLVKRIGGVSTYSKMLGDVRVKSLPTAFHSWEEYVRYSIETIIPETHRHYYYNMIKSLDKHIKLYPNRRDEYFHGLQPILMANDFEGVKFHNYIISLELKHKNNLRRKKK